MNSLSFLSQNFMNIDSDTRKKENDARKSQICVPKLFNKSNSSMIECNSSDDEDNSQSSISVFSYNENKYEYDPT